MLYPKETKLTLKPFFTAQDFLNGTKTTFKVPENIILMPSANMTEELKNTPKKHYDLFSSIDIINDKVAIVHNFSIGGPLCVFIAEMLAALGAKNFVLIGIAGAIKHSLKLNERVLCTGAFADEGTSRHYVQETLVKPSSTLSKKVAYLAQNSGYTWTTDAIFCETKEEVLHYEKLGGATVEMECAPVFAFAKKRGLKAAAVFVISDLLNGNEWDAIPERKKTAARLAQLMFDLSKLF